MYILSKDESKLMKKIIQDGNAVFGMDNKRYYVSIMEEPELVMNTDPKTKQHIHRLKKEIYNRKNFLIDDVVEMIDRGEL